LEIYTKTKVELIINGAWSMVKYMTYWLYFHAKYIGTIR